MSQPKPLLSKLSELISGQRADFFALLSDRTRGTTREGRPYYHLRFRDDRRVVSFMAWSDDRWFDPAEREWQAGQFYKLRAVYQEHERYGPQIELHNLRPVNEADREDGFDPANFVESSRHDPDRLWAELRALTADHIHDEALRGLTLSLLDRHAEPLKRLPLSRDRAYAYRGGLLEHLVSVTRLAIALGEHYSAAYPGLRPPLNRDLIASGAALHELGKVLEFGDDPTTPAPTVAGRLTGAITLGRDLLRDAAREHPALNPELLQMLEHVLLTPLYPADGPGPRWSLFPEGLLVQYADDLDLKMSLYVRCLDRDTSSGPFTERDHVLGRQLFKGRSI